MKALGIFLAVTFHLGVLLFGGVFLFNDNEKAARAEEFVDVEPVTEEKKPEEVKPEEKPDETKDETPPEETPQFTNPAPDQPAGPALAPLSMSDLESLLNGVGGEGGFGAGGGLSSGGVIGGSGSGGADGSGVLSTSQLDQKPRILVKVDPKPPKQGAKSLPQLTVTAFIDATGNVTRAEVAPAVDAAVQKAIMDAVMRWKYEPGQRGGMRVGCKVSHKLSFQ